MATIVERAAVALLAAMLAGPAAAAESAKPGAPKISPYMRYARQHAQSAPQQQTPSRVRPSTFAVGQPARIQSHARPRTTR